MSKSKDKTKWTTIMLVVKASSPEEAHTILHQRFMNDPPPYFNGRTHQIKDAKQTVIYIVQPLNTAEFNKRIGELAEWFCDPTLNVCKEGVGYPTGSLLFYQSNVELDIRYPENPETTGG